MKWVATVERSSKGGRVDGRQTTDESRQCHSVIESSSPVSECLLGHVASAGTNVVPGKIPQEITWNRFTLNTRKQQANKQTNKQKKHWHKCLWYSKRMTTTSTNYDDDEKLWLDADSAKWNVYIISAYIFIYSHGIVCNWPNEIQPLAKKVNWIEIQVKRMSRQNSALPMRMWISNPKSNTIQSKTISYE